MKDIAKELLAVAREIAGGQGLTREQIDEVKAELVSKGVPVRFLRGGRAIQIETGQEASQGSNVMYHPVYWNFTKETAKKIGDWLGARAVFASVTANVGDVEVVEPIGEGVSKTKHTKRMDTPMQASGYVNIDRSARPARMKKPKITTEKGAYRLYIQDLLWDVLVDKYGEERGQKQFDYFINDAPHRAMYPAGQAITDEKAQMYVDMGEMPPHDYFKESYFEVWKRWMKRPKAAKTASRELYDEASMMPRGLQGLAGKYVGKGSIDVQYDGPLTWVTDADENSVLAYKGRFLAWFRYGGPGLQSIKKLDQAVLVDYFNDMID